MMVDSTALRFKLFTKRLSSGQCQVKFYVKDKVQKERYGYALVDPKLTVKEVVELLEYQIKSRAYRPYYLNSLLNKERTESPLKNFLIFNA